VNVLQEDEFVVRHKSIIVSREGRKFSHGRG
jgi:hypothetical protein